MNERSKNHIKSVMEIAKRDDFIISIKNHE